MNKHIIWSDDINIDDWKDYIKDCYDSYIKDDEGYPFRDELEKYFDSTDSPSFDEFLKKYNCEIDMQIHNLNDTYLDDERMNLNIETEGRIICIAELGLWDGRKQGYSYEGNNISSCLRSHVRGMSNMEFYVEKEGRILEFKAIESHHDGTNYYTYRELKPDLSDTQFANFESKLYNGEATKSDIGRYTRSLGEKIQKVYGFTLDSKRDQIEKE